MKVAAGGEDSGLSGQADPSAPNELGNRIVTFKKGLTLEKKNFAYAHECAHLINGDAAPYTRPEGYNKELVEQSADHTAAAILIPKNEIYEYLRDNAYQSLSSRKKVVIINSLCRKYKVSEIIVLRRVKEVCRLMSAGQVPE